MSWVHCNRCKVRGKNARGYYVSSCGHLFCTNCYENRETDNSNCPQCLEPCQYTRVGKEMPQEKKVFFMDPLEHLRNFMNSFAFQNKHKRLLVEHCDRLRHKENALRTELNRVNESSNKTELAIKAAERELAYLNSFSERELSKSTRSCGLRDTRVSPYESKFGKREITPMGNRTFESVSSLNTPFFQSGLSRCAQSTRMTPGVTSQNRAQAESSLFSISGNSKPMFKHQMPSPLVPASVRSMRMGPPQTPDFPRKSPFSLKPQQHTSLGQMTRPTFAQSPFQKLFSEITPSGNSSNKPMPSNNRNNQNRNDCLILSDSHTTTQYPGDRLNIQSTSKQNNIEAPTYRNIHSESNRPTQNWPNIHLPTHPNNILNKSNLMNIQSSINSHSTTNPTNIRTPTQPNMHNPSNRPDDLPPINRHNSWNNQSPINRQHQIGRQSSTNQSYPSNRSKIQDSTNIPNILTNRSDISMRSNNQMSGVGKLVSTRTNSYNTSNHQRHYKMNSPAPQNHPRIPGRKRPSPSVSPSLISD